MTAAELDDLVSRFHAKSLTHAEWTHVAHLAVGTWHVVVFGADEALTRIRQGIVALNDVHGTPNTDTRGYHETITRAYVRLIADFVARRPAGSEPAACASALLESPVAVKDALLEFYSKERLMSVAARRDWIAPDLVSLPGPEV